MGLAPRVVERIFEFLRRLADSGTALLIVEQYVAKALELADIVYVISRGRVTFCGEPAELDADALAESYLGGTPDLSGTNA
jgi:branched-chain amino acid transport system ATP-binding protein